MADVSIAGNAGTQACAHCRTELAPGALVCPACRTLVHRERLERLSAEAGIDAEAGRLIDARARWLEALALLPDESRQHELIRGRVAELTKRIEAMPASARPKAEGGWWKRGLGGAIAVGLLLLGKLKFLILGLTKASTFVSMFAFFGVYWNAFGWPLALGLVVSIYIHEMGHVAMLKRLGLQAGAPLFIPGIGAMVLLKERIDDPAVDAKIGLAGPVWGLGAGLAAYALGRVTGAPIWGAIAQLTGWLNLFNLIPIWQLDGARGFHALSTWQRWGVVLALALAFALTAQKLLIIIGLVAAFRALQRTSVPGDARALATFVALVGALSWLAIPVR